MRTFPLAISLTTLLLGSATALAYPTSVVFTPAGDGKGLGDTSVFVYAASFAAPKFSSPHIAGSTWAGLQVGVLPKFEYGASGMSFGGLELGADMILSDLAGTPDAYIKPVFNAKLSLVTESGWVPNFSLGIMDIAPGRWNRSLNFTYGVLTKTLQFGDTNAGRLTLGFGGTLGDFDGDPYAETLPSFTGTAPFDSDARVALMGGYESPMVGPVYFAIDHIGGSSEISSTNVALTLIPAEGAYFAIGANFGSDPDAWFWGTFTYITLNWNMMKLFGGSSEEPPAAAPAPAPEAAPVPAPEAGAAPAP